MNLCFVFITLTIYFPFISFYLSEDKISNKQVHACNKQRRHYIIP